MNDIKRLKANLEIIENGRGVREMAVVAGISPASYARRRQRPEKFTYQELYRICKAAKVNVGDFCGRTLFLGGDGA